MDEEKNLNEAAEEVTEAAENVANEAADAAENAAEAVTEAAQDAADTAADAADKISDTAEISLDDTAVAEENAVDEISETVDIGEDEIGETVGIDAEPVIDEIGENDAVDVTEAAVAAGNENKTVKVVVISVCAVLVAAIIVLAVIFVPKLFHRNPYNKYIDTTGRTVGEIAKQSNKELDEFLEQYGLPADMPADTNEASAFNAIPLGKVLEMYRYENMSTVDEAKSSLGLPDWVDENTPWGDAVGEAPLKNYVGEENLDLFLEHYGLQGTANGDTLYKDVRQTVDAADKKEREEYEKQMEELQAQMEAQQSQPDETEAPADDQAQTEAPADAPAEQTDAADAEAQPVQQ